MDTEGYALKAFLVVFCFWPMLPPVFTGQWDFWALAMLTWSALIVVFVLGLLVLAYILH